MTRLVAREKEVARLTAAFVRAAGGSASLVLLGGDAGVGKSRLLDHLAEVATERGACVVTTYCVDLGEVGLPYLPFAEALVQLQAHERTRDVVVRGVQARPALGRLVMPGSAADVARDPLAEPPVRASHEDAGERLQLFDGLAEVLGAAGRPGRPLVLVLEDLHWADSSSRDVLRFLVTRLRTENVLLVASYRADDLHRRHPLRPVIAELSRHPRVERLELAPFTAAELARFAEAVAGQPLAPDVVGRIHERSEGNAYFAEEILEAGDEAGPLPPTLADVMRARLDQVSPDVQELARVASVAGRRVSDPLLRAVWTARGGTDFDGALREAVAAHVLRGEDGRIAFRHALLAEVVCLDLLPGEQVVLHRSYLDAMLADPSLGTAAQRAHHAGRAHDTVACVRASLEAAEEAGRMLAPEEELRHLETALGLWDVVPDVLDLALDRVALADAAAQAAGRAGHLNRAVTLGRLAVDLAHDDVARQAPLRAHLAQALLAADVFPDALEEARRALTDLPADAPAVDRSWCLAVHARACLGENLDAEATSSAQAALAVAREGGLPGAEADALASLAVLVVDDPAAAATLLDEARRRAASAGDLVTEQRCTYNLALTHYYAGHLGDAAIVLDAGVARSGAAGLTWSHFGHAQVFLVELVRYVRGDLRPRPTERTDTGDTGESSLYMRAVRLYSAVARGDNDAIALGRAFEQHWGPDLPWTVLISAGCTVDALTWAGEPEEAVALARRAIDHLGRTWDDAFLGAIWLATLGIAALADQARHDRARGADPSRHVEVADQLLERAVATAERGRPRGGRLGPEGVAWLARARAEHARLRALASSTPEAASTDVWQAATEAFAYGYCYEETRSRWRWAEALLATGDRAGALEQLARAGVEARAMGARPLASAIEDLARRARLDLPGRRMATDLLTSREAEVLSLVAEGLSNNQIGERLFISGKTVSVHVSNVLAKLGAASRTEAVTVAHRRGLAAVGAAGRAQ